MGLEWHRAFPTHRLDLYNGDALALYGRWARPTVIVADGPYGVGGYPGDPRTHRGLADWYEPHVRQWSERAYSRTTLWFWNTEVGWATVHPVLGRHGWEYRTCNIWDKGIAHVAGNCNTKTLRQFPVTTEVCVHYVRRSELTLAGRTISMQEWLRAEWERSGLPLSRANEAAGVRSAATRKYFTRDGCWYFPPPEALERFVDYANRHGDPRGRPYFSLDGRRPVSRSDWEALRAKFRCPFGVTNVWAERPVGGPERLKVNGRALHLNQKPLRLMRLIIEASSDPGDLVWEPFGGLATAVLASHQLGRSAVAAEVDARVFAAAAARLRRETGGEGSSG